MEDAFTIGLRLKEEALKARESHQNDADWLQMRSEVYIRDRGMCWCCNTFVFLQDYDLGHLIDRCNNGMDIKENLAVMHKLCNLQKPKHKTLEESMKWKLNPSYLAEQPISMFDSSKSIGNGYPYHKKKRTNISKPQLSLPTDIEKQTANNQLINSYFQAHPELTNTNNAVRLEAIKLLSQILNMPEKQIQPQIIPQAQVSQSGLLAWDVPVTNKRKRYTYKPYNPSHYQLAKEQAKYEDNVKKISPNTLCWIQGRPFYHGGTKAPMWKLVPPPYEKENVFTMRQTPPGAIDNGNNGIHNTIQILNGELLNEIVLDMGYVTYRITSSNGRLMVTGDNNKKANTGDRSNTIGMGKGQIPIEAWRKAKSQGVSLQQFKANYLRSLPIPSYQENQLKIPVD